MKQDPWDGVVEASDLRVGGGRAKRFITIQNQVCLLPYYFIGRIQLGIQESDSENIVPEPVLHWRPVKERFKLEPLHLFTLWLGFS